MLREVGLGYLRLGQPATELSGGEAQRIKLATELQRMQRGDTLYVLDEPTTGLASADVEKLMTQLDGLVEAGNTVIVVEHDMRVVAASDWVIDIGPGAGDEGGRIVALGNTPRGVPKRQKPDRAVSGRPDSRALALDLSAVRLPDCQLVDDELAWLLRHVDPVRQGRFAVPALPPAPGSPVTTALVKAPSTWSIPPADSQ